MRPSLAHSDLVFQKIDDQKDQITYNNLSALVMSAQISMAQGLTSDDLVFAFGNTAPIAGMSREMQHTAPTPQALNASEMAATGGEWIAIAVRGIAWAGSRIRP